MSQRTIKRRFICLITVLVTMITLIAYMTVPAFTDDSSNGWVENNTKYKVNNEIVKGWKTIGKYKYYFNTTTGVKLTGYQLIGKDHYYFGNKSKPAGGMVSNCWVTVNGVKHWIRKNGREVKATKYMAFTYDDGPSVNTAKVLKTLKAYGCTATFFQVGNRVSSYKSVEKKIVKEGSEIGNHTYNHADLADLSRSAIRANIRRTNSKIKKYSGVKPKLMRPPYGSVDSTVRASVGMPLIIWNVDTLDWKHRNTTKTVAAIMKHPKNGNIVLMHDLYSTSYHATKIAVPRLIQKGYKIVSVSQLAKLEKKTLKRGRTYGAIR